MEWLPSIFQNYHTSFWCLIKLTLTSIHQSMVQKPWVQMNKDACMHAYVWEKKISALVDFCWNVYYSKMKETIRNPKRPFNCNWLWFFILLNIYIRLQTNSAFLCSTKFFASWFEYLLPQLRSWVSHIIYFEINYISGNVLMNAKKLYNLWCTVQQDLLTCQNYVNSELYLLRDMGIPSNLSSIKRWESMTFLQQLDLFSA